MGVHRDPCGARSTPRARSTHRGGPSVLPVPGDRPRAARSTPTHGRFWMTADRSVITGRQRQYLRWVFGTRNANSQVQYLSMKSTTFEGLSRYINQIQETGSLRINYGSVLLLEIQYRLHLQYFQQPSLQQPPHSSITPSLAISAARAVKNIPSYLNPPPRCIFQKR